MYRSIKSNILYKQKKCTNSLLEVYRSDNKISPSYVEILRGCGMKSKSHAFVIINSLIKKDYLKKIGKYGDARRIIINRDYEKGGRKVAKTKH